MHSFTSSLTPADELERKVHAERRQPRRGLKVLPSSVRRSRPIFVGLERCHAEKRVLLDTYHQLANFEVTDAFQALPVVAQEAIRIRIRELARQIDRVTREIAGLEARSKARFVR